MEVYWIVEIQRPRDEQVQVGEGMLLWFDSYSTIGSHDTLAEESCASVRFMEYRKSEAESHSQRPLHGQPVSARRAYYMFDFNPLFKYAQYGSACAGTPGKSLPSRDQPLFVPKMSSEVGADTFSCVFCLNCPRGTAPKFTLRAAYVAQTPVVGLEKGRVRKAKYASYVILMLATDIIVMTTAVLLVDESCTAATRGRAETDLRNSIEAHLQGADATVTVQSSCGSIRLEASIVYTESARLASPPLASLHVSHVSHAPKSPITFYFFTAPLSLFRLPLSRLWEYW